MLINRKSIRREPYAEIIAA